MPIDITISNAEKVAVTATIVDKNTQAPLPLDGVVAFTVASGDGTVNAVDATTSELVSGTAVGDTVYNVDAMSSGKPVHDTVSLHVTAAAEPVFAFSAAAPVPK